MKKKAIMTILSMIFIFIPNVSATYEYNSDTVEVYVTVNDITDVDEPLNTIYERQNIRVSNFNIAEYGEDFTGISILDSGVTYLHVLIALHEQLYGKNNVSDKFKLDSGGMTRIFMGKSVGSIMYKNGDYIFAIPQYVQVRNGDEVNICLYDEGYNQAIASFNKSYIDLPVGGEIDSGLYMHHWYPEFSEDISGAILTDENGIFITDENGDMITTDENGDFTLSFDEEGLYKITIMPTLGYYMSQDGGTVVIWYEEEEVEKTGTGSIELSGNIDVSTLTAESAAGQAAIALGIAGCSSATVIDFDTDGGTDALPEAWDYTYTYTDIELIRHERVLSGEAKQKVDYTTPWLIVNVTNDVVIQNVVKTQSLFSSSVTVNADVLNGTLHSSNGQAICVAYDANGVCEEIHIAELSDFLSFTFSKDYSQFKIFIWDNSMSPLCTSYDSENDIDEPLPWDLTQPAPDNVIITSFGG